MEIMDVIKIISILINYSIRKANDWMVRQSWLGGQGNPRAATGVVTHLHFSVSAIVGKLIFYRRHFPKIFAGIR